MSGKLTENSDYMTIKVKTILKNLLYEKDISAAKLARATGVPPQTINNWLSGQEPRNLTQLKKVADYFEITVDYLVYGTKQSIKEPIDEYRDEINAGTFEVVLRRIKK